MHLRLLSSPDTAGTGAFLVRLPHPIPTFSSVALRTPQPTLASPMLSPPRSPPPIGPVSAPDWPDLRPDSPDIYPTFRTLPRPMSV